MGYEIDFLPVGDGERSGDAIAVRYGSPGRYTIHVIDSGDLAAGERMVEHIRSHYGNPRYIDAVVCTHGDDDHSSGLRKVVQAFDIGGIWMNRPWLYAHELAGSFHDGRMTPQSLERHLREAFPILDEIEAMALQRRIPVYEAFQGTTVGEFSILAPSRWRYLELVSQFSRTPKPAQSAADSFALGSRLVQRVRDVVESIREAWNHETLEENVETSPSNESSVVQMTVCAFLRCIGIDFSVGEIQSKAEQNHSIDVEFSDANFQTTDLLGARKPGRI